MFLTNIDMVAMLLFCFVCDLDSLNNLSFLQPLEALYEIWLQLTQWLLRRCLELSKSSENDLDILS